MGNTSTNKNEPHEEIRCSNCSKLLARGDAGLNVYEIKCTRCGIINSIFRDIDDQVVITDTNGVILYANTIVEKITGFSLSEILGKTPALWGGQMPKEFYEKMWKTIKVDGKPIDVVVRNKNKKGELYSARLRISPVFDVEGNVKLFVGMESLIKDNFDQHENSTDSAK